MTQMVLTRLQHLSTPHVATVKQLAHCSRQAWMDGAKSICYAHLSDSSSTATKFPLWVITYWSSAINTRETSVRWLKAKDWASKQLQQKKSSSRQKAAEEATILLSSLPRMLKGSDSSGVVDNERIDSLWRFLGPNWLSCSNQNDLLDILRDTILDDPVRATKYRVEGTHTTATIIKAYQNRSDDMYCKDRSLQWLHFLADDLIENQATLITIINLSNITNSPHWVPVVVTIEPKLCIHFGDSLGGSIPPELHAAYTWWLGIHEDNFLPDPFVKRKNARNDNDLLEVKSLPITIQHDSHSCGVLAQDALKHFVYPSQPLLDANVMDIVHERLKMFNKVAGRVKQRVRTHNHTNVHALNTIQS